ncbi:TonB-dependent receptor [Aliifodinibius sp. S!AR15-10]|uniref:TonB-dependent receptor plug domain-containing protein n=1 Tax=Aliifodinibius sp. S!AR15-10 TaxID=2950437 RepID=UPI0028547FB4|nr:TonB-dependent receptor [Aliifodinibius sp. S!AR15-10]MDR8394027.1 TonB-dependent receptor [Aliifodinibius sp. S!AR15-10]
MQFSYISRAAFTVLLLSLIALPLSAQIDTSKTYTLEEVIISANRWEESARSVGRNVTVISSEELRNSTYYSVGELLAEQQSLHMVGDGQTPGAVQSAFLRNTNSNHAVIMIDGVRISDPSTASNSPDLSELSLARVERIEIVRGSHSTLYGSSAIGGAVNIITRGFGTPGFSGTVGSKHGVFGKGTYSTANQIDLNYTTPRGFYADFGLAHEMTNGLDATIDTVQNPPSFNPQDQDDFDKLDLSGELGYKTDRFGYFVSYRREDQTSDVDQGAYSDARDAYTNFMRDFFAYGGSFTLSDDVELKYNGAYSDLARDFVNDSSIVDQAGNYDGSYIENNYEGSLWENELTAHWESNAISTIIGIGNIQQTMSSHTYTYLSSFNYESETNLDSLDLKESISHAFIHTELNGSLLNSQLESFSMGLGSRLVNHNEFGTHLTFELNPKVQVSPSSLVYGAVTSGFNAPSLYQLHSPAISPGYVTDRGNENLEAESSISYEVGWKQTVGSALQLNLSLFRTNVDNVIEYVYMWNPDREVANLTSADYLGDTYLNASEQQINGIEVGLDTRIGSTLTLGGNLSYTHSTLQFNPADVDEQYTEGSHVQIYESGEFLTAEKEIESLTRRPSISGNVYLAWQLLEPLRIQANTRFVGERDDVFYSSNLGPYGALDRSNVDGYSLTDISLRYNISDPFAVIGKVENLFDTDYTEINGYRTKGRGFFIKAQYTF